MQLQTRTDCGVSSCDTLKAASSLWTASLTSVSAGAARVVGPVAESDPAAETGTEAGAAGETDTAAGAAGITVYL
jgi:hypothetical protein